MKNFKTPQLSAFWCVLCLLVTGPITAQTEDSEISCPANPTAVRALEEIVRKKAAQKTSTISFGCGRNYHTAKFPLIVVDGVVTTQSEFELIHVAEIVSVNVLKPAQGAALYGSDGVNGVVIVTTKMANNIPIELPTTEFDEVVVYILHYKGEATLNQHLRSVVPGERLIPDRLQL